MAAPKRGLGRGLGALLGEPAMPATAGQRGLVQVPVGAVAPNPHQPRVTFAADALDELRASIAEFGVLVPIIVRRLANDRYELIAGERRWRAATAAGLASIPAIVRDADDRESLEVAIIENLQRENLDPLEEAMGFAHLMDAHAFTQEQVAQRVGRSRPAVANALRLLTLSDRIKAFVRDGRLSGGAARALLAIPPERRDAVAQRVVEDGLSVRSIEALAKVAPAAAKPAPAPRAVDGETRELTDRLRYRFATPVTVTTRGSGGAIEIRYADEEELTRIVDLLLGSAE